MPIEDNQHWRDLLTTLLEELQVVEQTAADAASTVELDQTRVGRLSRMDALQAQAMSVETNRRRVQQVQRIKAALLRLDRGDYGYCVDCDEAIDRKRLAFDPATLLCIACAKAREQQS